MAYAAPTARLDPDERTDGSAILLSPATVTAAKQVSTRRSRHPPKEWVRRVLDTARRAYGTVSVQGVYRFSTGISELDDMLNGGIPAKLTVAVVNDPENDASVFCQQFVWKGLKSGDVCVYFCYDHPPETVRANMARFGWDTRPYEANMDFILVDCYSARAGQRGDEKYWLERPFEPQRLFETVRTVEREVSLLKPGRPGRAIVDSFSALTACLSFADVLKLVIKLQGICKKGNYVGIGVLHKGMHGETNEYIARHTLEGVLELYSRADRRRLRQHMRVSKMCLTNFSSAELPYTVAETGIKVLMKPTAR